MGKHVALPDAVRAAKGVTVVVTKGVKKAGSVEHAEDEPLKNCSVGAQTAADVSGVHAGPSGTGAHHAVTGATDFHAITAEELPDVR